MPEQHDRDATFDALQPNLSAAPGADTTVRAAIRHGDLLFLSGQVAFEGPDLLTTGRLGDDVDVPTGQACARQCAINLLGRTKELLGSLREGGAGRQADRVRFERTGIPGAAPGRQRGISGLS